MSFFSPRLSSIALLMSVVFACDQSQATPETAPEAVPLSASETRSEAVFENDVKEPADTLARELAPQGTDLKEGSEEAKPVPIWNVDSSASELSFTGTQVGKKFTGRFENFSAEIKFDPENLNGSEIVVIVDTGSAKTGDRQRDDAMPGNDWFAAKSHPEAIFQSDRIRKTSEGAYEAMGRLTIRNISQEIALPFTLSIDGDVAQAQGEVQLIRTNYGVGQGEWSTGEWVALEVDVSFKISAAL